MASGTAPKRLPSWRSSLLVELLQGLLVGLVVEALGVLRSELLDYQFIEGDHGLCELLAQKRDQKTLQGLPVHARVDEINIPQEVGEPQAAVL